MHFFDFIGMDRSFAGIGVSLRGLRGLFSIFVDQLSDLRAEIEVI